MTFTSEFTVRFGEIDQARVVYYPRFFHILHQTFEEWFDKALGVSYPQIVTVDDIGFPSVKIETEFRKPLRYGDRVRVELELIDIGTRSLTIRYTMIRLPDGEKAAEATIKTVAIDNSTFKSVHIPQELRRRFEAFKDAE